MPEHKIYKRAKLSLIKPSPCKSSEQIIETLTVALDYAKKNKVHKIAIDMLSDIGSFHTSGESTDGR